MTDVDIERIERALELSLPEAYRRSVVPFGIPALRGNTEDLLWDDADALIELNLELRAGSRFRPAWPAHLYAVGDPHGDELVAIDTRQPEGAVWWLDHGMIDSKASYRTHDRFADWVLEFYRDMREDLEGDGYDPDGSAGEFNAARRKDERSRFLGCFAAVCAAVGVLVLLFIIRHFR